MGIRFFFKDCFQVLIMGAVACGLGFASVQVGKRYFPRWHQALVEPIQEKKSLVHEISLTEFLKLMTDQNVVILDARDSGFYQMGHVPGALNLARRQFEEGWKRLNLKVSDLAERKVVVYCSGADCEDSRIVAEKLLGLGVNQVMVFAGGWEMWERSGQEVER
ncbi:MAG: rhodanese-like domain-containing protein [Verrucomicrobiae bacterium]|nr:rhodanese-like domain-containing protein [Verrucomicrobiae bacterium]